VRHMQCKYACPVLFISPHLLGKLDELIRRDNGKESIHFSRLASWFFIDAVENVSESSEWITMAPNPLAGFNPAEILAALPFHIRPLSWLPVVCRFAVASMAIPSGSNTARYQQQCSGEAMKEVVV